MNEENDAALETHKPCPDCGSSDGLAVYHDHTHCFSCTKTTYTDGGSKTSSKGSTKRPEDAVRVSYQGLPSRRITEETCKFWSYGVGEYGGNQVQIAQYLDDDRTVVAQKIRTRDKMFPWINKSGTSSLYGQWLWRNGGKMLVITEGELDALSVSQVQNNKWPVVSLPNGAGKGSIKYIAKNIDWINKFEKVVLFFDNDEQGREAAAEARKLIKVGRCYITYAPEGYKDANDLLVAGKGAKIVDCIWGAKQYRPDGLVSGSAILKRLKDRPFIPAHPYPEYLPDLNHKTGGGLRMVSLDTWTSGTGMGKTTVIKELQRHFWKTTDYNQALIHLEEPLEDTGDDMIALELGNRFTVNDPKFVETEEYLETAVRIFEDKDDEGHNRFQLYDAFGSLEDESLYDVVRYAAKAENCSIIWLDHLSILVSDLDADTDERRKIDKIMHSLKDLTVELGININLISHLRKPPGNGKSFEQGAIPSLDDLRGSGAIKQLSNNVFALSRDQQADNPEERNISQVHVLKCRKTGRTGPSDYISFNDTTGRMEASDGPDALADFEDESGPSDY